MRTSTLTELILHFLNEILQMGNSISNHPKKIELVTHHLWISRFFYQWFTLAWVDKMQNFSPIQFVLLKLWPVKDNPYKPLPGGEKLHFCLAVFQGNCNILKTLCQISLKIWNSYIVGCWIRIRWLKEMNSSGNYAILIF